jgi:Gly-Xaa carboxypeptidase
LATAGSDSGAVGYLAQVIRIIEDQPFKSKITRHNPTLTYLRQAARLSKSMPEELREAILGPRSNEKILEYMDSSRERRAMVRTSTAVDVISGGDKGKQSCPRYLGAY